MHTVWTTFEFDFTETPQVVGRLGIACDTIDRAGGIVHSCCGIRKRIIYSAPRSLEPEINAAIGSKPGDRVS